MKFVGSVVVIRCGRKLCQHTGRQLVYTLITQHPVHQDILIQCCACIGGRVESSTVHLLSRDKGGRDILMHYFNPFYSIFTSFCRVQLCVYVYICWQAFLIGLKEMHLFSHTPRPDSSFIDFKHLPFHRVSNLIRGNAAHKQMHPYFVPFHLSPFPFYAPDYIPSLHLFLSRPYTQARRKAGRSTARHRMRMESVSARWWLRPRTCVIETHAVASSASSWRRCVLSNTLHSQPSLAS